MLFGCGMLFSRNSMFARGNSAGNTDVNPSTEIETVMTAEVANIKASRTVLGERTKLSTDVLGLYDAIMRDIDINEISGTDEEQAAYAIMLMLLAACRYQFTMSILQNWRGRAAEAMAPLRRASELCASACHIRRNPDLARVWISAGDSDDNYRNHKEAFKIKAIFPKSDPTLNRLFEVFDFSSKIIHCSIYSVSSQTRGMAFQYFDIGDPRRDPALIRTYIYILSAHETILSALVEAFAEVFQNKAVLEHELKIFADRLQRHREANRDFAMSDIRRETMEKVANRRR